MKTPYFQYFELDMEKLPTNGSGWAKFNFWENMHLFQFLHQMGAKKVPFFVLKYNKGKILKIRYFHGLPFF